MNCVALVLFLVLSDGRPGLSRAHTQVYTAAEGGNITARCLVAVSGNWKVFCKRDCNKRDDILVETLFDRRVNGRYSIKYESNGSYPDVIYVSITNVSSSDSGTYSCVVGKWRRWTKTQQESVKFIIQVTSMQTGPISSGPSPLLWLLLIPVAMVMTSVLLLLVCKKRGSQDDMKSTEKSRGNKTEIVIYENSCPAADSVYQSLSVDTMDPNQTYSTIRAQT